MLGDLDFINTQMDKNTGEKKERLTVKGDLPLLIYDRQRPLPIFKPPLHTSSHLA